MKTADYKQRIVFLKHSGTDILRTRLRERYPEAFDLVITSPPVRETGTMFLNNGAEIVIAELERHPDKDTQRLIQIALDSLGNTSVSNYYFHPSYDFVDGLATRSANQIGARLKATKHRRILVVGSGVLLNMMALHIMLDRGIINPDAVDLLTRVALAEAEAFDMKFFDHQSTTVEHLRLD